MQASIIAGIIAGYLVIGLILGRTAYGIVRANGIDEYAMKSFRNPVKRYNKVDRSRDAWISLWLSSIWPLSLSLLSIWFIFAVFLSFIVRTGRKSEYEKQKEAAMEDMDIQDRDGELFGSSGE